jgi:Trk-type K+ transport system membrane component
LCLFKTVRSIIDDYNVEKSKKKETDNQANNLNKDLSFFRGLLVVVILILICLILSNYEQFN